MQSSAVPTKIQVPFANSGAKNTIPVASQVSTDPALASYTDGFPPATRTALAAGGKPPYGQDFNGILNAITAIQQWQSAGGLFKFDSAFSTAIGGYPKGAVLESSIGLTQWRNTVEGNTTDPDSTSAAGWISVQGSASGYTAYGSGGNPALIAADAGKIIVLSGTAAGTLFLPVLNTVPDGATYLVKNESNQAAWVVACAGADGSAIVIGNSTAVNMPMLQDDFVIFVKGGTAWRTFGTGILRTSSSFAVSKSTSGYQKLPTGLIIQWGSGTGATASVSTNFPIAFPNAVLGRVVSLQDKNGGSLTLPVYANTSLVNLTSIGVSMSNYDTGTWTFGYFAIGY